MADVNDSGNCGDDLTSDVERSSDGGTFSSHVDSSAEMQGVLSTCASATARCSIKVQDGTLGKSIASVDRTLVFVQFVCVIFEDNY